MALEVLPHSPRVGGFEDEVHLLADLGRILLDDGARVAHVRVRVAPRQPPGERDGDGHVLRHQRLDARAQHLDDDFLATVAGPVYLPKRCRRDRCVVKSFEQRFDRRSERSLDLGAHQRRRHGLDPVLQRRQARDIWFGDEVSARREDLGDLDEGGAERGDGVEQVSGSPLVKVRRARRRRPPPDPTPDVAEYGDEERKEPADNHERAHTW